MKLNATIETIMNHRSIRKYKDKSVDDETLFTIIQAGQMASTSSNVQAYSIIKITDKETRKAIAQISGNQLHVIEAPVFLVWCADLSRINTSISAIDAQLGKELELTENFIVATVDTALAAQNASIAAESLGLGLVYIGGIRNDSEAISQLLQLPQLVVPLFGMCIGYPDEQPHLRPRFSPHAVLHNNTYNHDKATAEIADYNEVLKTYVEQRSSGKQSFNWSEAMSKRLSTSHQRDNQLSFINSKGMLKR